MTNPVRQPKTATARTTTVKIQPPSSFDILEGQYQLVRYVLPENLAYSKDKNKFARLHNELKEHLDAPYRVYTNDRLDGKKRWAVYVLYPRQDGKIDCPPLKFEDELLPSRELRFDEPELHIVIKLLQVAYFRDSAIGNLGRFVGQDKCYVYARRNGEDEKYHICLEIEIKGDRKDTSIFSVFGNARTFAKDPDTTNQYINRNIYYSMMGIRDDLIVFNQLKPSQVASTPSRYIQRPFTGSRTVLDYHSSGDEDAERSRGYLIDTFIRGFTNYLTRYEFQMEHITRNFTRFEDSDVSEFDLPVQSLNTIYVYDRRFNQQLALETYVAAFRKHFPNLTFQFIDELPRDFAAPVLVFEDCRAKAFEEGMPLHSWTDPHQQIYVQMPSVVKQFINVNENIPKKEDTAETYLEYETMTLKAHQVKMAMNQLFLKDLIMRGNPITNQLPLIAENMIFIHRENRGRGEQKQEYEVALYFEGTQAHFLNLRSNEERNKFYALADTYQVGELYDTIRTKEDSDEERIAYDLILGENLCAEIVDANEAVMHEFEKIVQRIAQAKNEFNLDDLKLAHHYDELAKDIGFSVDILTMKGFIQKGMKAIFKTNKERDALALYHNLHKYDNFLDSLKNRNDSMSFRRLTSTEDLVVEIEKIFESTRKLHNLYKKIGMFEGVREEEVIPVYKNIWYTEDLRYVVGDTNAMNDTQANAHRIRQFIVHQGELDIQTMLEAMSVQFVRLNQYTVRPYYFHLIDLYIDNVLQYL